MGNKLVTDSSCGLHQTSSGVRQIANYRRDDFSGQKFAQLGVTVADKKVT
jgi:hypothetical protein